MRVDRWNAGTLRRYHLPSGAIVVCGPAKRCVVIPAWCRHISAEADRTEAARHIRAARRAA